ncbi:MAG TPA: hypothetical protein VJN71_03960, partial [Nitrososphaerales archaeon]|nr:hypothetical protein [Nitrososphaerales archaeon]
VAVSPPVGFGFVSYGLALEAASNVTLRALAEGFWNYYYAAYENSEYGTPYARSLNLLTLAGFKLYGCNSTVETFARNYLGNTSGGSIEEYGWGAAALYALKQCTGNQNDADLYDSFVNSFGTSESRIILLSTNSGKTDLQPEYTFQFGETASGLMLGGLPYSSPIVIGAMNAVLQSNQSGTLLNQPFFGDFANTETLPAYMLSMSLFQGEMRNQTGLWITSLTNGNITSIDYANGTLLIGIEGYNSSVSINGPTGIKTFSGIYENRVLDVETAPTSISILTTTTSSSCAGCIMPPLSYLLETALLTISACLVLALFLFRKRLSR